MTRLPLTYRLGLFWVFTLVVAISLGALLDGVYNQGAGAQISQATRTTQDACRELQRKFLWGAQNKSFEPNKENQFQNALLEIILDHYTAVEGGFWNTDRGFVAYAYPTYEGSGIKKDVPDAEKASLANVSEASIEKDAVQTEMRRGRREAMILTACPIDGASAATAAWTMTRVPLGVGDAYDRFVWGLALLLGFVVLTGAASTLLLFSWSKNLKKLASAIQQHSIESLPELPATSEVELNSIVTAFNELNHRLRTSKEDAGRLARQLTQANRLAALGKMAAGVAHEIRNPLATMRLKLENAMVAPAERLERAAPIVIEQMSRMERLVQMMLAMTQPFELKAQEVDLQKWFDESFIPLQQRAASKKISVVFHAKVKTWSFDPFHMARAIENLLTNAIVFTPERGSVMISAYGRDSLLILEVQDSGRGISQEVRESLFEPFTSGRPGGIGLGLSLVREIVEAHGGRVYEEGSRNGACFRLEVPWLKF